MKPKRSFISPARMLVVLALCAFPLAIHWRAVSRGLVPWFMDTVAQFYPFRYHCASLLHSGQLPFWNRTVFAGVPLLANPQWGVLYPGHWPFFIWPGGQAWSLINAGHIAWMGLGMAAWLAVRGRRAGALAAGLLVQAGAWPWAHLAFGSYIQAAAWAPWMLAGYDGARRGRLPAWALLAGVAGAMQVLSGAPQLAMYSQIGLAIYAIADAFGGAPRSARLKRAVAFLALQGALAAAFSAPQWLPSLHLAAACERGGALAAGKVLGGALSLKALAQAWIGGSGQPEDAEQILYPGVVALVLALVGWGAARRHKTAGEASGAWAAMAMLALACIWTWKPATRFLYNWCPLVSHFHDPRRILFLGYLAVAMLAGEGIDYLWRSARHRDRHAGVVRAMQVAIVILAVGECVLFVRARIDTKCEPVSKFQMADPIGKTGIHRGQRFYAQDTGIQYSYNYTRPDFAESLLPNLGALYGMEDIQGYDPFIPWRYGVYMRRLNTDPASGPALYPSHFGLVRSPRSRWLRHFGALRVRGVAHYSWPFLVPRWLGPGEEIAIPLYPRPRVTTRRFDAWLYAAVPRNRGETTTGRIDASYFQKDKPADLRSIFLPFQREADRHPERIFPDVWPIESPRTTPVVPALSSHVTPINKQFDLTHVVLKNREDTPVFLYSFAIRDSNQPFRPILPRGTCESTWDEAFPSQIELRTDAPADRNAYERWAKGFLPNFTRVEIPPNEAPPAVPQRAIKAWQWAWRRTNSLAVDLPEDHDGGWLILSEPWARGWSCRVDGEPTPIRVADVMFRAVAAPAGARRVVMRYAPPGLRDGILIALAALLAFAGFALRPKRPNNKRKNKPETNTQGG